MASAALVDASWTPGRAGVPLAGCAALKDVFTTIDMPTTAGSKISRGGARRTTDGELALRAAGSPSWQDELDESRWAPPPSTRYG